MQIDDNPPFEDNAPGQFYVGEECIHCYRCGEIAPNTFRESEAGDHHFVHRQPVTEEEISLAEDALAECPVEAIATRI